MKGFFFHSLKEEEPMDNYYPLIKNFAQASGPSPWQLDRFDVATKLLRILDNPDLVFQARFGCCGEVAFLRAWLLHDPITVANFAIQLFNTGSSHMNKYQADAASTLLQSTYIKDNPGDTITSAVWMICGALADAECDFVSKFSGDPSEDDQLGTMATEVARWMENSCIYDKVEHNLCAFNNTTANILTIFVDVLTGIPLPNFYDSQTIDGACNLGPDPHNDIILAINSNMLRHLISCDPPMNIPPFTGGLEKWYANHWVMLEKPIENLGSNQYRLTIWTWGNLYTIVLSGDVFNDNYFGAIHGHAPISRRKITPKPLGATDLTSEVDAWYSQQKTLEVNWVNHNPNTEWFDIDDVVGSKTVGHSWDILQSQPHFSAPIPDLADPHSHFYRVASYNAWGTSPDDIEPASTLSSSVSPICRTETGHFHISYYAYPSYNQIRDGDSHNGVEVKSADGLVLGHGYSDGRMEIIVDGGTQQIHLELNTPDYIEAIAITLEYCYANSLCRGSNLKTEVTIQKGGYPTGVDKDGRLLLSFDPQLPYANIPLVVVNTLIDLDEVRNGITPGDPQWDTPSRYMIQDRLLHSKKFIPLLQSYPTNPELGLRTPQGAAAYIVLGGADTLPMVSGQDFVPYGDVNFYYSDQRKDVYNSKTRLGDFALEVAKLLVSGGSFSYAGFTGQLPKPLSTTASLTASAPASFQGKLQHECSLALHVLTLSAGVPNLAVAFQAGSLGTWSPRTLLQIILLDASDNIIDLIRTEECPYQRTIGLRNGTVRKIIFTVANRENHSDTGGFTYTLQCSCVAAASDVMITRWNRAAGFENIYQGPWAWDTPDLWLTSDKTSIPIDVIDVQDDKDASKDFSIVHVRLHNYGNQAAHTTVWLYFQKGSISPSDSAWNAMALSQITGGTPVTNPNGMVLDVPANGTAEGSAHWYYPERDKEVKSTNTVSLAAGIDASTDQSADNNRTTKNHASTNAKVIHDPKKPGSQNYQIYWTDVRIPNKLLWGVDVVFDGGELYKGDPDASRAVQMQNTTTPGESFFTFSVDVARLLKARTAPVFKKVAPTPLQQIWLKPFDMARKTCPMTFSLTSAGKKLSGFTVDIPVGKKQLGGPFH
jgi:hypothetical protein